MRKGWKVFWITCIGVAAVGFTCCIAGAAMGATVSAMNNQFPYGFHILGRGTYGYHSNEKAGFVSDASDTFSGIRDVNIEVNGLTVEILPSTDKDIKLETSHIDTRLKFNYYVDDGELVIETKKNLSGIIGTEIGTICLYLPESGIEDVDIEIGAGELHVENLNSDSFSLKAGAGNAVIDNFTTRELDFDCGVGDITAEGQFKEEAAMKCGIGSIEFTTSGKESDYNYEVACGIGEVNIGDSYYSGLGSSKDIDNGSDKELRVECGIGNVEVQFID